jgi:G3E family GTPase
LTTPATSIPVSLLTGFLGSGKTTLASRILKERTSERIAVIVNEFGEMGIDGDLILHRDEEIIELANGCICCNMRGDLARSLKDLLERRRGAGLLGKLRPLRFDRVLIEASGLASPGPVMQTLILDEVLSEAYRLDRVVALAHARHIADQLEQHPEAGEQLAYADVILLNHIDRLDAKELELAERALRERVPQTEVRRSERARVPLDILFAPDGETGARATASLRAGDLPSSAHSEGVSSLVLQSDEPLDLERLKMWLQFLTSRRGQELMRLKAILNCTGHEKSVVVHAIHQWLELGPGEDSPPEQSRMLIIGRDLDHDELRRGWDACQPSN